MTSAFHAALFSAALILPAAAREFSVVTYNVENLFDADGVAVFADYEDTGKPQGYSPAKLLVKIVNIAQVLRTFNQGAGPEIVCFNEFEIDFSPETTAADHAAFLAKYKGTTVDRMLTTELSDDIRGLPAEALLLKYFEDNGLTGYQVAIGKDKPNLRALAHKDRTVHGKAHKSAIFSKFPITAFQSHPTTDARDILEATIDVGGHPLIVFVNHWKSRASDVIAEQARRLNAKTLRQRLDAVLADNPSADILVTGDFNSQYNQSKANPHLGKTAVNEVLGSQGDEAATASATGYSLYNLWHELPPAGRFSDEYNGTWGTLMQMMVTPGLYDHQGVQYVDNSFSVVTLEGVNTVGPLKRPRRWTNAGGGGGFSDHFPISARFLTSDERNPVKRLVPVRPGTEDSPSKLIEVQHGALNPDKVPAFASERAEHPELIIGDIFRATGTISSLRPLTIKVESEEYLLHSRDKDLRQQLRAYPKGGKLEFLGEFSMHQGKFQFVIDDKHWILHEPAPRSRD